MWPIKKFECPVKGPTVHSARFWDLFAVRSVLYPIYIANAPHARFESMRSPKALPVFAVPLAAWDSGLQLVMMRIGGARPRRD